MKGGALVRCLLATMLVVVSVERCCRGQQERRPELPVAVSAVRQWDGFGDVKPVDPYTSMPAFSQQERAAYRRHYSQVLAKYIGRIEQIGKPPKQTPLRIAYRPFDRWERVVGWTFRGTEGSADVWIAPGGKLQARISPAGDPSAEGDRLIAWSRTLVESLWQGKLPEKPDHLWGQRDVRQTGMAWQVVNKTGYSSRELKQRVQVSVTKRRGPDGVAPGGKVGMPTYRVEQISIACGTGPKQFAEMLADKPKPLSQREAIAQLYWAIQRADNRLGQLGQLRDWPDARVSNVQRGAEWEFTVAATFTVPPAVEPGNRNILRSGADVAYVSVNPHRFTVRQTGRHRTSKGSYARYPSNADVALAGVAKWEEYAAIERRILRQKAAEEELAGKRRRIYEKHKVEILRQARRAVKAVSPKHAPLAEETQPLLDASIEQGVIRLQYGKSGEVPRLFFVFRIVDEKPRMASVYLEIPATEKHPQIDDRKAWQAFAAEKLKGVYGRDARGKLQVQPDLTRKPQKNVPAGDRDPNWKPNYIEYVWLPQVDNITLPESYGMRFYVTKGARGLGMALSQNHTLAETERIIAGLKAAGRKFSPRKAMMTAVANLPVLAPEVPAGKTAVTEMELVTEDLKQLRGYRWAATYIDEQAFDKLAGKSPVVLLVRVQLESTGEPGPYRVTAWLDPADGKLIRLASQVNRKPSESKSGG